jgi:hypothetical protein
LKNLKEQDGGPADLYMRHTDIDGNNHSQSMLYFKTGVYDLNISNAEMLISWRTEKSG